MHKRPRSSAAPKYEDFQPVTETKENPESHLLHIHLPGFKRDEIGAKYESSNKKLRVFGERPLGVDNRYSRFNLTHRLPENCDANRLQRRYVAETLTIIMPKKVISRVPPKDEPKPTPPVPAVAAKPPEPAAINQTKPEIKAPEVIPPKSAPEDEPKPTPPVPAVAAKPPEPAAINQTKPEIKAPEVIPPKSAPEDEPKPTPTVPAVAAKPPEPAAINQTKPEIKAPEVIPPKSAPEDEPKPTPSVPAVAAKPPEPEIKAPEVTPPKSPPKVKEPTTTAEGRESASREPETTFDKQKQQPTIDQPKPEKTQETITSTPTLKVDEPKTTTEVQEPKTAVDKQKQEDEKKLEAIIPKRDTNDSKPQKEEIPGKATVTTETKDQVDGQKRAAGTIADNVEKQEIERKEMKEKDLEKASDSGKQSEKSSVGGSSDQKERREESKGLEEKEKKKKINGKVGAVGVGNGKEDAIEPKGKGIQNVITRMTKKLSDEDKQMLIYVGAGAALIVVAALGVYASYKFRSLPR